ncbi:hypothetical protein TRAPUB_1289 [Trametes pubescens]|uniref:DUF6532 domain-containing protein n=1 Tax=Trametes pubescens TaxID=154538 RepID=A0A1M2VJR5_TRAPU|nr:hypothetical protein TRAPUB_1289 [Trametes pubescens]
MPASKKPPTDNAPDKRIPEALEGASKKTNKSEKTNSKGKEKVASKGSSGARSQTKSQAAATKSTSKAIIKKPPRDEFRIETLPTNRTSEKANTINLHAHARAMPRSSVTPHTTSTKTPTEQRTSVMPSTSTASRRLTKEGAARLAALRNPFASLSRAGSPSSSRPQPSQRPSQRYVQDNGLQQGQSLRTRPPSETPRDGARRREHEALEDRDSDRRHNDKYTIDQPRAEYEHRASGYSQEPRGLENSVYESGHQDDEDAGPVSREYQVSGTSERHRHFGQLPLSRRDQYTQEGAMSVRGEAAPNTSMYSQYGADDMLDYSSQPRARAHALAYADDSENYQQDLDHQHREEPTHYSDHDIAEPFDNGGSRTPYDNHTEDPYSPLAGTTPIEYSRRGVFPQAPPHEHVPQQDQRVTRCRSSSEVSYEERGLQQRPTQRRRTTRSPSLASGRQSSSPVPQDRADSDADNADANRFESDQRDYPKAQYAEKHQPGGRPKQGDYEEEARDIMGLAAVIFKGKIMAEYAYPSKLTERVWARTAWFHAAEKLSIELAPTAEALRLVAVYSWNLRGELKRAARGLVQGFYGFKPLVDPPSQLYNRQLAALLSRNRTFTYETINKESEEHEGLYESPLVQMIINLVFFKNATDDGVLLENVYQPFPLKGLALVLTAIQCAIDEWHSGVHSSVTFSENNYSSVYTKHIRELELFELASGEDRIVHEIRGGLSAHGR